MKKILCIFILSCLVLVFSCDQNGFGTVEGYVYEYGTNVPIPNVYIRMNRYSSVLSYSPFRSATSDHNGYYKIKYFNNYFGARYYLDVISGEHKSVLGLNITQRKSNFITYLNAYTHYKIRIKNNLPYNVTVVANLNPETSFSPYFYVQANKDTTYRVVYTTVATKALSFSWYYITNPTTTSTVFYDTIPPTSKFDTITHLIQVN